MGAERLYSPFFASITWFIPGDDGAPPAPADSGRIPLLLLYIVGATEKPDVPDADRGEALDLKDATVGLDPGADDWSAAVAMPSPLDPPSGTKFPL